MALGDAVAPGTYASDADGLKAELAADPNAPPVNFAQVVLDSHDCLMVSGTWAESLYLGDRSRSAVRLASAALVNCDDADLPAHGRVASPLLRSYEAMVLVSALSA